VKKPKNKRNPLRDIADASERALRTIEGYRDRGMPTNSVKAALQWIESNIRQNIGQPTLGERKAGKTSRGAASDFGDLEVQELREKIRKLAAEAEAKELKNAEVRGELYNASEVERNVAELTGLIRVRLESIPDEIEMDIIPEQRAQLKQRWVEKIRLILTEMSQFQLTCDDDASASEREFPSATTDENAALELQKRTDA
jgi:phage terminase Nu1 subunit (DNA packaging protein)